VSDNPYRRTRIFRPKALGRPDKNAHPLVRALFAEMRRQQVTMIEMQERAGVARETIASWRDVRTPDLVNLEACLNVLGLHLTASPSTKTLANRYKVMREALQQSMEIAAKALDCMTIEIEE